MCDSDTHSLTQKRIVYYVWFWYTHTCKKEYYGMYDCDIHTKNNSRLSGILIYTYSQKKE